MIRGAERRGRDLVEPGQEVAGVANRMAGKQAVGRRVRERDAVAGVADEDGLGHRVDHGPQLGSRCPHLQ